MKLGMDACISSRITTVIHVMSDHQINYNCFNEPFAVSPDRSLHWDMHGLIFETSIWLLAGSTRFLQFQQHMSICNWEPSSRMQLSRSCCTAFKISLSFKWNHSMNSLAKLEINSRIYPDLDAEANLKRFHRIGMRLPSRNPHYRFEFCHWIMIPICSTGFKIQWTHQRFQNNCSNYFAFFHGRMQIKLQFKCQLQSIRKFEGFSNFHPKFSCICSKLFEFHYLSS